MHPVPNHYNPTQEEIDDATYMVEWGEERKTGQGYLYVTGDSGAVICKIPHDEPINAKTDSWRIAEICAAEIGTLPVGSVEHDKDTIWFRK